MSKRSCLCRSSFLVILAFWCIRYGTFYGGTPKVALANALSSFSEIIRALPSSKTWRPWFESRNKCLFHAIDCFSSSSFRGGGAKTVFCGKVWPYYFHQLPWVHKTKYLESLNQHNNPFMEIFMWMLCRICLQWIPLQSQNMMTPYSG
jgi:hypothetical protein